MANRKRSSAKVIAINHKHQAHFDNVKRKAEHLKEEKIGALFIEKKHSSLVRKIECWQRYAIFIITKRSLLIVELFKMLPRSI